MKTNLFTLFLALVASAGTALAGIISIDDNSIADWNKLPSEYVFEAKCPSGAALTGLKNVKVYSDLDYIYILVEPNMEAISNRDWVPFHVFLNIDNSDATGGYSDLFADANADIVLEGGVFEKNAPYVYDPAVYKWWGEVGGSGWNWTDPSKEHNTKDCWGAIVCEKTGVGISQYIDGKFEIRIDRSAIPAIWDDTQFGIGFDIEQNWSAVGVLPCVAATDGNASGKTGKLHIKTHQMSTIPIIDGIRYSLNTDDQTAEVIKGDYTGNIEIPTRVTYLDKTYEVTGIHKSAFCNCINLTAVTIPNSIVSIGDSAFVDCSKLNIVALGSNVESIGNFAFSDCKKLSEINMPNSIKSIGVAAFWGCSSLTSITIPNSVTYVYGFTFYDCSNLEKVVLGNEVETIDMYAFSECERIIDIYSYAERVPTVKSSAFDGVSRKAYVWVPANRLRNYQTHEIWGEFLVQAIEAEGVNTTTVTVTPDYNTAKVIWPVVDNADSYAISITDKEGKIICTLEFNSDGMLQSIAFGAPSCNNTPSQTQSTGFRFEVTGLEEGTSYDYSIAAKDATETTIQTFTGSFKTLGGESAVDNTISENNSLRKELRNGQLYILRDGKTYTVQGQEVR